MEEELIAKLQARNFDGLAQLISLYGDPILRTVRSILKESHERSEWEATENEIFYAIWEKIGDFDPLKASFATWLLMIARSKAIDQKRRLAKVYQQTQIDETSENSLTTEDATPLAEEEFMLLVDTLSEEDQQIFLFYYFYQETPRQIAELLQLEPAVIYNRLSRGRRRLKQILTEGSEQHGI